MFPLFRVLSIVALLTSYSSYVRGQPWPSSWLTVVDLSWHYDYVDYGVNKFYGRLVEKNLEGPVVDGFANLSRSSEHHIDWVDATPPGVRTAFYNPDIRIPSNGFFLVNLNIIIASAVDVNATLTVTTWHMHKDASDEALAIGPMCTGGSLESSAYVNQQVANVSVEVYQGVGSYRVMLPPRTLRVAHHRYTHISVAADCGRSRCMFPASQQVTFPSYYGFSVVGARWSPQSYSDTAQDVTCWRRNESSAALIYKLTAFSYKIMGHCDLGGTWAGMGTLISQARPKEIQDYVNYSPLACRNFATDEIAFAMLAAYGCLLVIMAVFVAGHVIWQKVRKPSDAKPAGYTDNAFLNDAISVGMSMLICLDYCFSSLSFLTTDVDVETDEFNAETDSNSAAAPPIVEQLSSSIISFLGILVPLVVPCVVAFVFFLYAMMESFQAYRGESLKPLGCCLRDLIPVLIRETGMDSTTNDVNFIGVLYPWRRLHRWSDLKHATWMKKSVCAAEEVTWAVLQIILLLPSVMLYAFAISSHLLSVSRVAYVIDFLVGVPQSKPSMIQFHGKDVRTPSIDHATSDFLFPMLHVELGFDILSLATKACVLQQAVANDKPLLFAVGALLFLGILVIEGIVGLLEVWAERCRRKGGQHETAKDSLQVDSSEVPMITNPMRHASFGASSRGLSLSLSLAHCQAERNHFESRQDRGAASVANPLAMTPTSTSRLSDPS